MKKMKMKNLLLTGIFAAGLSIASCGGNNNQSEGAADANEANGDAYGTESPADNQYSGSVSDEGTDAGMATDTVQRTTTQDDPTVRGSGIGESDGSKNGM
ncbi:hypothetical protein [Flavobacterium sp.]|uniref:hypothetical protein n=1 Tax=Flavobacterium sp. TaxID=239 RepID=UPI0026052391|nr:hypothetical protein [Flavobacterium sp.]